MVIVVIVNSSNIFLSPPMNILVIIISICYMFAYMLSG